MVGICSIQSWQPDAAALAKVGAFIRSMLGC